MAGLVNHRQSGDARVRRDAFAQQAVGKHEQRGGKRNRGNRPQHPGAAFDAVSDKSC